MSLLARAGTESRWIEVRTLNLGGEKPKLRLVHITDIHYKGDKAFAERWVRLVNGLEADCVCFTGDLIERNEWAKEALDMLSRINKPIYAVYGNHDFYGRLPMEDYRSVCRATGGDLLFNSSSALPGGAGTIHGQSGLKPVGERPAAEGLDILLYHYPKSCEHQGANRYDLQLAGHSHGGQVRLPFRGPVLLPGHVGRYDMGLFDTQAGPLYVNRGLGTYSVPVRFLCRPEITLLHL